MKKKMNSTDPDILGSLPALRRAAKAARKLSILTGTPFYVLRNGKVVDLNPVRKRSTPSGRKKTHSAGRSRKS